MLNIVVFSKDRSCQCDLTIRSIKEYVKMPYQINVLYTYSSEFYRMGYEELLKKHNEDYIFFRLENNFKQDTEIAVNKKISEFYIRSHKTLFLADDEVFIRELNTSDEFIIFNQHPDILGLKLYLGKNIKQRFGTGDYFEQPEFGEYNMWDIDCGLNLWKYHGSITLQIYKTVEIYEHMKNLNYSNPNSLEIALVQNRMSNKSKLMCFDENKTCLLQWNRVQNVCKSNKYGSVSTDWFNEKWLKGKQLSLEILDSCRTDNFEFLDAPIIWEERNGK
jgi:hypothetical protein